jgi:hypothetical protein
MINEALRVQDSKRSDSLMKELRKTATNASLKMEWTKKISERECNYGAHQLDADA